MAKKNSTTDVTPETETPEGAGPKAAIYKGSGEFFGGIPARDLSVDDFEELTPGQRELCVTSGLYTVTAAGKKLLPDSPVLETVKPGEPFKPEPFALSDEPAEED